jgi:hypothetical protein
MTSTTWQDGVHRLLRRVDAPGERVTDGFPHYGNPATGRGATSPGGDWTAGFWNGLCWLAALARGETQRARYQAAAEATVTALVEHYLDARGILSRGCYNQRINLATQHELIWGSYYLFEALHVLSGALPPAQV